jgi:glutaconate CoA-transferase subunit A
MSKVQSLQEAVSTHVCDGMSIALGCGLESLIPFAASHEIIRQHRKNLTLIGPISDAQFDQLIGAGCVRKVQASWVGNVAAGLGHSFRRAAESGEPTPLEIEEHSNFTIGLALQASAMGLPFLPTRSIKGSDIAKEAHFGSVRCPFTGEELLAVPAIRPDLAILHVQRADDRGNAHFWGNLGVMREAAMAAKKVILTCEELVDHALILSDPNRNLIPGFVVTSVVHQPNGSFPSPTQGFARRDDEFYFEYHRATRSVPGVHAWLEKYIYGVKNHRAFLDLLGKDRTDALRPEGDLFAPAVSFNY